MRKSKKSGRKPPKKPTVSILSGAGGGYVTVYRHYRTGKLMDARKYGYKAWPFGYNRA